MTALGWKTSFRALFFAVAGAAAACAPAQVSTDPALAALIQRIGQAEMGRSPEEADMLGLTPEQFGRPYGGLLNDRSMAVSEATRAERLDFLDELERIDRAGLSHDGVRTLDSALYVYRTAAAVDAHGYGYTNLGWASPYLITFADGAFVDLVKFLTLHSPVRSRADAEAWLARLDHVDEALRDERRRFEVDIAAGAAPPRAILQRTLDEVRQLTPVNPREHPLTTFFVEALAQIPDISEDNLAALVKRSVDQVGGPIRDEYRQLAKLLEAQLAKAPPQPGVWQLKGGDKYYAEALKLFTTTELTPAQLHDVGVKQVEQLTTQIDAALVELGKTEGTVAQRLTALAADPAYLFPDTPEGRAGLMDAIGQRVKWAETQLGRIILQGPKGKVDVREAPRISQDTAPGAYYKAAPLDGSRPATYNLNLRTTLDFPSWRLPTLTYHEAAPGHHIQAGLAREKTDQPIINYLISYPAFSEGWAVYAEDLADELGAYSSDKLSRIGYLQSLLFRAARMVADTGIHAERWTREDAVAYLQTTTGLPRADMEFEVDRYTIWPGQACSYMAGREIIRRLHATARRELGQRFDLKAFHQEILRYGPRPLPVLEADIAAWVAAQRPQPTKK